MKHPFEAWRRRLWQWTVPLVFFALNLAGFLVYRTAYSGNVEALHGLVEAAVQDREAITKEREAGIAYLERITARREAMRRLYEDYFATEAERLTTMIREAKSLARRAGLTPKSINYPDNPLRDQDMLQQKMVFPVEGTYDQLRQFINFLELSEQFLTLERISVSENQGKGGSPVLSIQLELSTVFVEPDAGKRLGGAS